MEQKSNKNLRFPLKFSPIIIVLCIAVILLCGGGIALSVIRIIKEGIRDFYAVLKSPFLIAICAFGIAIVTGMLIRSSYIVTDKHFITQFGFIKSSFDIKSMTAMVYDREKNKVSIYFGEEFSVVSVSSEWVDNFIKAILEVNPDVDYSFTLSDAPDKDKKDDDKKDEK